MKETGKKLKKNKVQSEDLSTQTKGVKRNIDDGHMYRRKICGNFIHFPPFAKGIIIIINNRLLITCLWYGEWLAMFCFAFCNLCYVAPFSSLSFFQIAIELIFNEFITKTCCEKFFYIENKKFAVVEKLELLVQFIQCHDFICFISSWCHQRRQFYSHRILFVWFTFYADKFTDTFAFSVHRYVFMWRFLCIWSLDAITIRFILVDFWTAMMIEAIIEYHNKIHTHTNIRKMLLRSVLPIRPYLELTLNFTTIINHNEQSNWGKKQLQPKLSYSTYAICNKITAHTHKTARTAQFDS